MKLFITSKKICLLFVLSIIVNATAQISNLEALVSKNDKCVLKIITLDENGDDYAQGSGVLIDSKGIGITNFHVLEGALNAYAINHKGERIKIEKIIDYSMSYDLVKFQLINTNSTIFPKVSLNFGKNSKGASVFSIGYPRAFDIIGGSTVSQGIISGIRKDEALPGQGEVDSLIQTTAQITHGSSGGGLFDSKGNLIGITQGSFIADVEDLHANLNKAIPIKYLKSLKRKLNFSFDQFLSECAKTNLFAQGILAYNNGDYVSSYDLLLAYQKVNELNKLDPRVWYLKGNCAFHLGRKSNRSEILQMALENYSESLILDSMNVNARSYMALTFEQLGKMEYAFQVANDGYNINPKNAFVNYVLGKLYNSSKNSELAIKYFTQAINLFEEKDISYESLAQWYLERAIAYDRLNYNELEEQDYKRCLILSGDKISQPLLDGLFYYGDFLVENKRYSEACIQFKRLKQLKSDYTMQGYTVDQMLKMYKCN